MRTTVRRKEQDGSLPFTVDEDGVHRYRAEDVAKVQLSPRRRGKAAKHAPPGKIAAAAFRRFRGGASARDIVEELEITPERARELFEMWMSPDLAPPRAVRAKRRVEENL